VDNFIRFAGQCGNVKVSPKSFFSDIKILSSFEDRSTGTSGVNSAAEFIEKSLADLEFGDVKSHLFLVPTLLHHNSKLTVLASGQTIAVNPISGNAISPETIGLPGIEAPLVYVGGESFRNYPEKKLKVP
jgi:hypothetical protein